MKKIEILVISALLAACADKPTPIPDATSSAGELYAAKCGSCHSIPHPKRHSLGQWEHMIGLMEKQMKQKGMTPLSEEERSALFDYLKRNSRE